ncbi:MAG: hypothetical protein E6Q53_00070 [Candidatus Moraniibacteriota bacterium]|nr:MAG: hypothetical protein E6Q53_00070 [Candidatus Moranbacteria bacterium]
MIQGFGAQTKRRLSRAMLVVFMLVLIGGTAQPAKADVWGAAFAAELMGQIMDTIKKQLEGAILGTLKVAAIQVLSSQTAQMIGGTTLGNALFITDWYDYLYQKPAEQTKLIMNDFFTITTRGKYASANYVGAGDVTSSVSGNYPAYLVSQAKQSIGDESTQGEVGVQYDLDSYCSSPDELFQEGDYRCFNAMISNPANNPFGYTLSATAHYARTMNQKIEQAKTEAQSSGFTGKKQGGKTIAPAATIERMLSDVQNIGNNLIAAASNPNEFLSGVVNAVVNKAVSSMIQKGVGKVQANIEREIKRVDAKVNRELTRIDKQLGPAAKFTNEWSQKTNVYIKPYTAPPPGARQDNGVYCGGVGC